MLIRLTIQSAWGSFCSMRIVPILWPKVLTSCMILEVEPWVCRTHWVDNYGSSDNQGQGCPITPMVVKKSSVREPSSSWQWYNWGGLPPSSPAFISPSYDGGKMPIYCGVIRESYWVIVQALPWTWDPQHRWQVLQPHGRSASPTIMQLKKIAFIVECKGWDELLKRVTNHSISLIIQYPLLR